MGNTSAHELLELCLRGEAWPRPLLDDAAQSPEFFSVVIEGLADRFDPKLCDTYARLFAEVIDRDLAAEIVARYQRVRQPRPLPASASTIYVLSRVTLGADVAITSVVLDAAKRRYPDAEIVFVGPQKSWELFAADERLQWLEAPYSRTGALADRLASSRALADRLTAPNSIVVDPDSRLTQLGLIPVCTEDRYYFFESRASTGSGSLSELTAQWMDGGRPYIAPHAMDAPSVDITISLGVGENEAKRLPDPFERDLLRLLSDRSILIDKGGDEKESARVERAIHGLPNVRTWQGAFAPFAAQIARSKHYIGYDSAGQHVAAACGVPLITIFAGSPNERFFERWRPTGTGRIDVIRADNPDPAAILEQVARRLPRP